MSKRDERRRKFMKSPDGVQAAYWNGFITRVEAQKVFDEQKAFIMAQAQAIQKLDTVLTFITQKLGITIEDVNKWVTEQLEAAKAAAEANQQVTNENGAGQQQEPSSIVLPA